MKVRGTNISMIKGDSETITVSCSTGLDEPLLLVDGDIIYFTMKENVKTKEKVLQKVITVFNDGKAIIELNPTDTKFLRSKTYVYDIQLTRASGTITTLVTPSDFIISDGVTDE